MSQHLSFMVFGADAESLNRIDGALATSDRATLLSSAQNERQVRVEIGRLRPSAAIIVLGESPEERLSLIRDLTRSHPETMLIAAASNASPDLILNSLRAGATEFLRLPLLDDEFATILDHAEEYASRQSASQKPRGRVIAVFSNKGGCGTSFIASNLALAMGAPTVLVDLNFQTGDLGFFFQVEPKFSILNLCENLERMDEELLSGFLANYSPHLSILPAPTDLDEALEVRAGHVTAVIDLLRNTHDFVVLDLPHTFDEITLAAFDDADDILVVTTLDIMAVRNMQRVVSTLERLDCPREKIRAVVNRWSKGDLDVGQAQIERLFSKNSMTLIPNDYRAAAGSINLGQPLVGGRKSNAVASEIKRLAGSLAASSDARRDPGVTPPTGSTNGKSGRVSHAPTGSLNGTLPDPEPLAHEKAPVSHRSKWKGKISSLLRTG